MNNALPRRIARLAKTTLASAVATLLVVGGPAACFQGEPMRQYQFDIVDGEPALVTREVARPSPRANEVLVRVRAVSLNQRDLTMLEGAAGRRGMVPLSDGAGEVIAVGSGVTRFEVGDRVAGIFFAEWLSGRPGPEANGSARGGSIDGMLSEMIVSHEDALVEIPEHLSFEEAATLPCAAVTAWNGLFKHGTYQEGDFVLLEGTGGVSLFGLQFSVAAGARSIITSSSDEKLERAREMGAFGTANYRANAEWQDEVRELTGGGGVHHVLDVGGESTLPRAIRALASEGHIAIIGGLTGFADTMPVRTFVGSRHSVSGIYVGSREDFEAMNRFIAEHALRPVVDTVFAFDEAAAAFDFMANGDYMGKIVITIPPPAAAIP
jgi:NADPH:quinone reductase-like Zn-dependent oxidoreductase